MRPLVRQPQEENAMTGPQEAPGPMAVNTAIGGMEGLYTYFRGPTTAHR